VKKLDSEILAEGRWSEQWCRISTADADHRASGYPSQGQEELAQHQRRGPTVDGETVEAYDRESGAFAQDWHEQPAPTDLQARVREFFTPGSTADIGCGSGRDTAWLSDNGFPATGYDPSSGLLAQARRRYPAIAFHQSALPELDGIADASFTNVLCETVIMHLEPAELLPSLQRLVAILAPGGALYLSWRVTQVSDRRDEHGRLYAVVDPDLVNKALSDLKVLLDEELDSTSSGKRIRRIVARKH